jgi:hypothetical protein
MRLRPQTKTRHENPRVRSTITRLLPAAWLVLSTASPARAVQTHTGTEGLISHELGHLLFTGAMVVLLVRMVRSGLNGPGWRQFRGFLWLIIAWNILTFAGHWMREGVPPDNFIHSGDRITGFRIDNTLDLLFYLTRLDHLLLVPAFFMLLLAILQWGRRQP